MIIQDNLLPNATDMIMGRVEELAAEIRRVVTSPYSVSLKVCVIYLSTFLPATLYAHGNWF